MFGGSFFGVLHSCLRTGLCNIWWFVFLSSWLLLWGAVTFLILFSFSMIFNAPNVPIRRVQVLFWTPETTERSPWIRPARPQHLSVRSPTSLPYYLPVVDQRRMWGSLIDHLISSFVTNSAIHVAACDRDLSCHNRPFHWIPFHHKLAYYTNQSLGMANHMGQRVISEHGS
jgi:hypothetical protein